MNVDTEAPCVLIEFGLSLELVTDAMPEAVAGIFRRAEAKIDAALDPDYEPTGPVTWWVSDPPGKYHPDTGLRTVNAYLPVVRR